MWGTMGRRKGGRTPRLRRCAAHPPFSPPIVRGRREGGERVDCSAAHATLSPLSLPPSPLFLSLSFSLFFSIVRRSSFFPYFFSSIFLFIFYFFFTFFSSSSCSCSSSSSPPPPSSSASSPLSLARDRLSRLSCPSILHTHPTSPSATLPAGQA